MRLPSGRFFRRLYLYVGVFGLALFPSGQTGSAQKNSHAPPQPDSAGRGAIHDGLYRNSSFGFNYRIPFGWVERTDQMGEGTSSHGNSHLLLAVFERPPEATGDTVNSAAVITAESVSSYPGLQGAQDFFEPLTEITNRKGLKIVNQPYDFKVGSRQLVRGDFSKELGTITLYQGSLVTIEKAYILCFTFIAGSEDELEELIGKLHFVPVQKAARPVSH